MEYKGTKKTSPDQCHAQSSNFNPNPSVLCPTKNHIVFRFFVLALISRAKSKNRNPE